MATTSEVLRIAASIDQGSEHPLAHAIVAPKRAAAALLLSKPETFDSASGIGVRGVVDGRRIALGNTALMDIEQIDWPRPLARPGRSMAAGKEAPA